MKLLSIIIKIFVSLHQKKQWNAVDHCNTNLTSKFLVDYCLLWFCISILESTNFFSICSKHLWCRGLLAISTVKLHWNKPELRFCAGSNHACSVSEIRDGEDIWQGSRLELRLSSFRRSTIQQKQFIKKRKEKVLFSTIHETRTPT